MRGDLAAMKIGIIGAGGVGGYFGGLLARGGLEVTFVARGAHAAAIRATGLTVRSVEGELAVTPAGVVDSPSELGHCDVILIATKAYDLDAAVDALRPALRPDTIVIPLLNGIDHDRTVQARLGAGVGTVYPGFVYILSARTEPGVIEQTGGPRTMFFGDRTAPRNPRLVALEERFRAAGVLATAAEEIVPEMWKKFIWLSAFSAITAVCRSAIGPILEDSHSADVFVRCLDESIRVASSCGIEIEDALRNEMLEKTFGYLKTTPNAKSSMLVDIENGRRTEIDHLSGAICRLGKARGAPTPIHDTVYAAVKAISR